MHADSISHLTPTLQLEPSGTFSVANGTRGTRFIFAPVAGAAAVTALRLAQIETQALIALQQLASLVTVTVGNPCHNNGFAAALPPHLALLSLLNRQRVAAVRFNVDTNCKTYRNTQQCLSTVMYHHHSQQQGSQPFASGPRPPHHRPPPNEHQSHPASGMMSSTGFPFPRPTQLPDELESALAIHGVRDMDHRLVDIMNQSSQHENQSSASRVPQHGNYTSSARGLASEDPQGIEWSAYQPPTKLFASPPPSGTHQPQRLQAPHQQPQSSHAVSNMPRWAGDPPPQARRSGGDGQGLYTPESAGSILASFGLSNEDLEVLSHYPDDQLTPDTLPFILRDIQISKSGNKKPVGIGSAPPFPRNDRPLPSSRSPPLTRPLSPNVPSLLTVTQTAGKVIDYGHASRATTETTGPDTFKREQLSSERTVKMYPSSSSSSSVPKKDIMDRRQVRLEHTASSKYGDQDYRRAGNDHRKSNRSPGREFPLQTKSRYEDIDYRPSGAKFRSSAETTSEASSRRPPSSSYKKMPTPTMISDFSANTPKVYPHTCSLCHIQCDQEKVSASV